MTREEAQIVIGNIPLNPEALDDCYSITDYQEAKAMAIKALEQEPCEDCISRTQALSDFADWYGYGYRDNTIYKHLKDLPPATPQPKMGHWIKGKCDQCGGHAPFWPMASTYYRSEYCPSCGSKMIEPQESEDEE